MKGHGMGFKHAGAAKPGKMGRMKKSKVHIGMSGKKGSPTFHKGAN